MMIDRTEEPWHLDKRVPIALIVTVAVQTAVILWWAASINAQVEQNSRGVIALQTSWIAREREDRDIYSRLAVIESSMKTMGAGIDRIERAMPAARSSDAD